MANTMEHILYIIVRGNIAIRSGSTGSSSIAARFDAHNARADDHSQKNSASSTGAHQPSDLSPEFYQRREQN